MNISQKNSTYKCDECHDTGFIIEKLGSPPTPCWRNCIPPRCRWCSNYGWYWINAPVAPGSYTLIQKKKTCYYCEIYKIKINGALQIKVRDVD